MLRRARELVKACREGGVLCIINDRPDIAVLAGADGVHVGQEDVSLADARKFLGSKAIIGVSCQNVQHVRQAQRGGADYIGFGSIFKTKTTIFFYFFII